MKKGLIYLLLSSLLFVCYDCVSAEELTIDEIKAQLDSIPYRVEEENKILDVNMIDPDIIIGNRCDVTDYDEMYESYIEFLAPEERITKEEYKNLLINECKADNYALVLQLYLKSIGVNIDTRFYLNFDYDYNFINKNEVNLVYYDEEEWTEINYRTLKINYTGDYSEATYNNASEQLSTFKKVYSIYGMKYLNMVYHQNSADFGKFIDTYVRCFSEIQEKIDNNKTFDYEYIFYRGGQGPYGGESQGAIAIFKDGTLYKIQELNLEFNKIIFVDKDDASGIIEKAKTRIQTYFKDSITLELYEESDIDGDYFDSVVNGLLNTTGVTYTGKVANANFNGIDTTFVIVEIDKELLDNVVIKSLDKDTGVSIETSSYDVPIDAILVAKDSMNKAYVKKALEENNLEGIYAYDLTLTSQLTNSTITKMKNGIEVYIPVDNNYKENDKVNIYYVKENSKLGETIKGTVVKIDGKLYAKFTTTHFSTYVVAEEQEENPKTSDTYLISIITFVLSAVLLLLSKKTMKKNLING